MEDALSYGLGAITVKGSLLLLLSFSFFSAVSLVMYQW